MAEEVEITESRLVMEYDNEDYGELRKVLDLAYNQAAVGKGKERHARGRKFEDQPINVIPGLLDDKWAFSARFQAVKKIQEVSGLPKDMALREILGAIVYLAGAYIQIDNAVREKS